MLRRPAGASESAPARTASGFLSPFNERNLAATEENKTMHINDLLKIAVERKASDLHLKSARFPSSASTER
jgi:hypothetical protein